MGALVTATLVWTLLDPAFLLTQEPQDLPPEEPGLNLSFDPWTMTLTWDCRANSTDIKCAMSSGKRGPVTIRPRGPQCCCAFSKAVLHGGAVFTVTAQVGPRRVTERLSFTNAGGPGTAAQNVSCLVYKADFMNCTWAKGPAAPENVQYFLHVRDLGSGRTRACPRYLGDPGPTHTGCHLQGASAFGSEIYVLVNGTSPGGGGIQFYDATVMLKRIEVYDPPGNITVDCNSSHCLVRWDTPTIRLFLSDWEMQYQLDVHRQNRMQPSDHQLVDIAGGPRNIHIFLKPLPRGKHMARMRAADSRLLHWGPWSPAVEFGSEEWAPGQLLALLAVLGTVVCVLIALFLFNRFVGAPVPRVRDKLNTTDDEIIWDKFTPDDGKGDPEDVFHVEEPEIGKPSAKV